ncbi:methyltransferase [Acetobacter senegalensis]|uniref:Methyltransferase n=2 Tax=Acetobacter TaxID=434 RepID=A0A252EKA3_9PROT|nr:MULTISPECIES: methyltransferase domain-containing protein [Acetobacter]ATJ91376.1 SAM-dependent methyltransferase [Acetobacter tropicalis]OUL66829.1 methyltransferase [Acetobacter senegalensis]
MEAPIIFDRHAVRLHKARAARLQHTVAPILTAAADILLERLDDVTRPLHSALDLGGRGIIAPRLLARGMDVICSETIMPLPHTANVPTVCADEEWLPFAPQSFDLVVANLSLHWINDLPGTLSQIRQILKPDGLFLASVPILPTLRPLKQALEMAELALSDGVSPRVSPLPTQQSCAHLLQRTGFALPVVDTEKLDLRYRSLTGLMQDLRAAGETNALKLRSHAIPPRMLFPAAAAELATQEDQDGSFAMPLHMAILTAWSPSPSQPKPLQPGQFTHSLEEALNSSTLPDTTP